MSTPLEITQIEWLFDRMQSIWGVQKMSSTWSGANPDDIKRTWARTLGKYPSYQLRLAVEAMADECGTWPPPLTEFVALVRSKEQRPEHRRALPLPNRTDRDYEVASQNLAKIREMLGRAVKRIPD